jgi:hypothetical protein
LLRKFDEIFQAFQNPIFKEFFVNNYQESESPLRVLLEHQGIVRCYFQLKYIQKITTPELAKLYEIYGVDIYDHRMDYAIDMDEDPEITTINSVLISNLHLVKDKSHYIDMILSIKTSFFSQHKHELWGKLGISVDDYYDQGRLEAEASKIFLDEDFTKDDFIHIDWSTHVEKGEKEKPKEEKACYSMIDLWIVIIHTFLYMLNYYALSPTAYDYVEALGFSKS